MNKIEILKKALNLSDEEVSIMFDPKTLQRRAAGILTEKEKKIDAKMKEWAKNFDSMNKI